MYVIAFLSAHVGVDSFEQQKKIKQKNMKKNPSA